VCRPNLICGFVFECGIKQDVVEQYRLGAGKQIAQFLHCLLCPMRHRTWWGSAVDELKKKMQQCC